jgi:hypothetical protein
LRNLDGSENPAKNSMSPFNGNFIGGDGEIHNITELIYGGSGGSGGGSDFDPDSIIVQELGTQLNKVMSQDAVSKELAKKLEADDLPETPSIENIENEIEEIRIELDSKLDAADFPELPADLVDDVNNLKLVNTIYSCSLGSTSIGVSGLTDVDTGSLYIGYVTNTSVGGGSYTSTTQPTVTKNGVVYNARILRSSAGVPVYATGTRDFYSLQNSYVFIRFDPTGNTVTFMPINSSIYNGGDSYFNAGYQIVGSVAVRNTDSNATLSVPLSSVVYAKAPKASPTFTGTINLNGNTTVGITYTISHYRVPTVGGDLTNKLYVDTAISNAVSNVADQFGVVDKRIFNPYSWTPDEEIDFGDGLYGMRRTGSITAAANTDIGVTLESDASLVSVIGGWWRKGTGNMRKYFILHTISSTTGEWDHSVFTELDNVISWGSRSRLERISGNDDSTYDIAFTYIKTQ